MKRTADAVIVGGGCMGASVAYHLARRGMTDVVLLERETMLGTGSTGRNAGGVRHQFSNEANIRLSIESIGVLERFADEVGHAIDFHQDGYLFLLSSQASVDTFRKNVALQRSLGVDVQWFDVREAALLAPGLNVDGAIGATFCQRDGIADPNGVTMGFAKAAQAAGVSIERDTEVTGIRVDAGRVAAVETTRGAIETKIVVNAAGPHARHIGRLAGIDVPVDPYRRHIFIAAFDPSAGSGSSRATSSGNKHRPGSAPPQVPSSRIMVIDFETTFYFHHEGAGPLFGMGDPHETPTFDTTVQWDFLPQVIDVAVKRLPALTDTSISHTWAVTGRVFTEHDTERSPLVVVISRGLARRAWPNASPIGRTLLVGRFPGFAEVVGVGGDVKNNGLAREPMLEMYTPYSQRPWSAMQFAVRAEGGDPMALVNAVREAVLAVDRDLPITRVETMDAALSDSIATERLMTALLVVFAAIALLMAAVGLYGVIAYTVAQRTREIGVRVALGAEPRSVIRLVAAEGLRLTGLGMIIGTAAAVWVSRAMRAVLFDVSPADPATYAAVLALFAATACAALVVPARRALRVDPISALRAE